ncbi:tetraspanin-6 [Xiphophorus couchianus]|uniref:tetraspanin-6 n=1 Tax=Xiphophorus couchianus TaxID=32473 RepID=UPI001016BDA5|nr:tetraspanin-6 [Xiphophorus couchianus]XP_027864666.1 tetraspanin-6 [Xiphophorus couchianus]XP_027864667.1 tetraspanin-6 [Xiphophorus couchianus]XP_027864668.1 tetraspanin-6 [Xiphophorus couchianus]
MSPPSRRLQTKPVITCLKTFLISYSLIFWFTGVILLAVGVWGKVSLEAYFSLVSEDSTNAPYVLIGTGAIIVVFGLFGCFATCRGSPWMLKLYAMFLTLVFLAELIAGVSGFIFRHEIKDKISKAYEGAVQTYDGKDNKSKAVDALQKKLHCCGMTNSSDWGKTEYSKFHGIPMSCCKSSDNCTEENMRNPGKASTLVFPQGCFSLVTSVLESNLGIIAGVSFGIAFFQVIGIFLACCLSRYITNNQYEMV